MGEDGSLARALESFFAKKRDSRRRGVDELVLRASLDHNHISCLMVLTEEQPLSLLVNLFLMHLYLRLPVCIVRCHD